MPFEFATATRIVFGEAAVGQMAASAASMGSRTLVVTGSQARVDAVTGPRFSVAGEPSIETVRQGVALARAENCDVVVAIGGGSVIDAGKAIAAMLANPGDLLDYIEVIGRGRPLPHASVPFIAVPT